MNLFLKYFKKHHALFLLVIVFLWWAIIFVSKNFELQKLEYRNVIELKPVGEFVNGKIVFFHLKDIEVPEIKIDITDPYKDPDTPSAIHIECWQCGKKIPSDSTVCQNCGAIQEAADSDQDGMPNWWEVRYGLDPEEDSDAEEDKDNDKYTNLNEYLEGSDPTNSKSTPLTERIEAKVIKIYRKPLSIMFRGYAEPKIGEYDLEINWEVTAKGTGRTYVEKIGEAVKGYRILEFRKKIRTVNKPKQNLTIDIDESFVIIKAPLGQKLKLTINKIYTMEELFARIELTDVDDKPLYKEVDIGKTFKAWVKGELVPFIVTEILFDRIHIKDEKDQIYILIQQKK